MALKYPWFKFAPTDWVMGKIQRCSEITQARFIRLCCLYWNKEGVLSIDDATIEIDSDHLKILTDKKIVKLDQTFIKIEFLDDQMTECGENSDKKRAAALIRWAKNNADAMHVHADAMQNDADREIDKTKPEKKDKKKEIEDRKLKFASTLEPFLEKYGRPLLNDFYKYWTEPNKSNTKFRQELEKTWSLERRLETWAKNDKQIGKSESTSTKFIPRTETYVR